MFAVLTGAPFPPENSTTERPHTALVPITALATRCRTWSARSAGASAPDGKVAGPITGNLRVNNGDALVAATLAGQGLIYQPIFLVSAELRARRLVPVTLDHPPIELGGSESAFWRLSMSRKRTGNSALRTLRRGNSGNNT